MDDHLIKLGTIAITEVIKSVFPDIKQWLISTSKENDFLGRTARKYCSKTYDRFNSIKIFGMKQSISLNDLYITVNIFTKKIQIPRHHLTNLQTRIEEQIIYENQRIQINKESVQDIDLDKFKISELPTINQFNEYDSISPFLPIVETKEALDVVRKEDKLVVLGKPGSGKTTFLKYLTLKYITSPKEFTISRIPIFITLKSFSESGMNIIDYTIKQLEIGDVKDPKLFVIRLLEKGKCFILFDGLDEVSEIELDSIISTVIDFTDQYNKNKYIISCRIAAYSYWFSSFRDIELADFDKRQIKDFIYKWFIKEPQLSEECWNRIKENTRFLELASTPLLLTLICIAYDEAYQFPYTRAELYEESTNALLKRWDSNRRIRREQYVKFSLKRKEALYSAIAVNTFENNQYFIQEKFLIDLIEEFFNNLNDFDLEDIVQDKQEFIKKLESQHGLIVQRSFRIYSFSHLSIQEYYVAKYIKDNADSNTIERLVKSHLWEVRWSEVFLIISDLLSDSGNFLLLIVKEINIKIENHADLINLIYVVNLLTQEFGNDINTKGLSLSLTVGWFCDQIPPDLTESLNLTIESAKTNLFYSCINSNAAPNANKIRNELSFNRSDSLIPNINKNKSFLTELNQLLYSINLLIKCLNSDMTLEKRNKIENELFKVSNI